MLQLEHASREEVGGDTGGAFFCIFTGLHILNETKGVELHLSHFEEGFYFTK